MQGPQYQAPYLVRYGSAGALTAASGEPNVEDTIYEQAGLGQPISSTPGQGYVDKCDVFAPQTCPPTL
jgi:hypothetical protein